MEKRAQSITAYLSYKRGNETADMSIAVDLGWNLQLFLLSKKGNAIVNN